MKKIIVIVLLLNGLIVMGQNGLTIVPMPVEVKMWKGEKPFLINQNTKIILGPLGEGLEKFSDFLNAYLRKNIGFELQVIRNYSPPKNNFINISLAPPAYKHKREYGLNINSTNVSLNGFEKEEVFNGLQTLIQLIQINRKGKKVAYSLPSCNITDYPRFQYRGMHLDVARHFYPIDFIKKYIDYLAAYKFNTFHWHLTDDQGWRIEIKKYPLLTKVGGYRNGTITGRYPGKGNDSIYYGGFYTQQQIKEVVQYAAERYIIVIPEIEMPGHASAAIAAYPQLSCFPNESTNTGNTPWSGTKNGKQVQQTWGVFEDVFAPSEYTFNFLQDVLDEVMPLFPSQYIHIGGDECPKESWKRSAFCQQLIKDNNLKDEHGLQSYFIQRIEKYINNKGKKIIGWDEILEGGLAPNATVMSWRGEEGGIEAAKQNHDVIMTPGSHCYIDHSQSKNEDSVTIGGYLPLEKVYSYEPIPAALNAEQAKHILGAQGNLWTEYIKNSSKVEYMIFPRMIALSEVLWSPKEKRNWADFERRLPAVFERLDKQKINYSKAYYDLQATVIPKGNNEGILWKLESKNPKDKIVYLTGFEDSRLNEYKKPITPVLSGYECLAWIQSDDFKVIGNVVKQKFSFNKATGKKITLATEPSKNYPGDGAFTLVNGVQNEKGLSKGNEFLGFSGTNLDATIDLGKETEVSKISLHTLQQNGSWIYLPSQIEVSFIPFIDTTVITKHAPIETVTQLIQDEKNIQVIQLPAPKTCRYIRVYAKNYGIIPSGKPGAGEKAWLFADEIEVE
jgi:hexosaminidase